MNNDDYNEREGRTGEYKAFQLLEEALKYVDFPYYIVRNAIMPFESIYGDASAEFDMVLFTPYYIFLFEVKNAFYSEHKYDENHWILDNNKKEETSNPLYQNHIHKVVFCSEINVSRENVITIEVLLKNGKNKNDKSPYVRDYVFDQEDMEKKLKYLIASESPIKIDYKDIYERFKSVVKTGESEIEKHRKRLKRIERIETRIRRVIEKNKFLRTDMVLCPECKKEFLQFRNKKYNSTYESQRASNHYMLGCKSYRGDNGGCHFLIYVDEHKDAERFKKLKPVHIEDRKEWKEEKPVVKTFLDEMAELKSQLKREEYCCKSVKEEMEGLKSVIGRLKLEATEQAKKIKALEGENRLLNEKVSAFDKVIGRIYILKSSKKRESI